VEAGRIRHLAAERKATGRREGDAVGAAGGLAAVATAATTPTTGALERRRRRTIGVLVARVGRGRAATTAVAAAGARAARRAVLAALPAIAADPASSTVGGLRRCAARDKHAHRRNEKHKNSGPRKPARPSRLPHLIFLPRVSRRPYAKNVRRDFHTVTRLSRL